MFTNKTFDTVGFDSQVSVAKSEVSANVQTTEIIYSSNEIQTVEKKSVETQTVQEEKKIPSIDYDKLATFLNKVTPEVLKVLDEAYNTTAFDDYNPGTSTNTPANLQLLKKLNTKEESQERKISDLSWSIAGGTLAVSYIDTSHSPYSCCHPAEIQLYSLSIEDKLSDTPNKTLDVNSCVTSLSYHPVIPSILAAGLVNGNVLIWNLRNDDFFVPIKVCTHADSISHIYWNTRISNGSSLLASSSKDGYIMVHKLMPDFTTRLHKQFKIILENKPEVGQWITTFDFSWKDPTLFIVGTLNGRIYKCSLRVSPFEGDKNLFNPVIEEYDSSRGSIVCVKCSPTRNLFVTCSLGELRIYDFDQNVSQQTISMEYNVLGLTWMVGNQDVFATYGADATIEFYNVTNGKAVTNVKIKESDANSGSITSLCVNSKRDVLAVGDTKENIEIWKVPRQLF